MLSEVPSNECTLGILRARRERRHRRALHISVARPTVGRGRDQFVMGSIENIDSPPSSNTRTPPNCLTAALCKHERASEHTLHAPMHVCEDHLGSGGAIALKFCGRGGGGGPNSRGLLDGAGAGASSWNGGAGSVLSRHLAIEERCLSSGRQLHKARKGGKESRV